MSGHCHSQLSCRTPTARSQQQAALLDNRVGATFPQPLSCGPPSKRKREDLQEAGVKGIRRRHLSSSLRCVACGHRQKNKGREPGKGNNTHSEHRCPNPALHNSSPGKPVTRRLLYALFSACSQGITRKQHATNSLHSFPLFLSGNNNIGDCCHPINEHFPTYHKERN